MTTESRGSNCVRGGLGRRWSRCRDRSVTSASREVSGGKAMGFHPSRAILRGRRCTEYSQNAVTEASAVGPQLSAGADSAAGQALLARELLPELIEANAAA